MEDGVGTETDGVLGEDSKTETELGLVSSKEDTTEGIFRQEFLEHQTDATEGLEMDTGTGR